MVKDKPNSIRTYDEDGFRKRAACLCVRNELEDEVSFVHIDDGLSFKLLLSFLSLTYGLMIYTHYSHLHGFSDIARHIEWE